MSRYSFPFYNNDPCVDDDYEDSIRAYEEAEEMAAELYMERIRDERE